MAIMLFEEGGDLDAALAAARRLQDRDSPGLLSTGIREEGRLLERLGRNQEAAEVYRHSLRLRTDAEPRAREMDDRIRARLEVLQS